MCSTCGVHHRRVVVGRYGGGLNHPMFVLFHMSISCKINVHTGYIHVPCAASESITSVTTPSLGGTACSVPDSFLYLWNHVCVPCEHDVSFWIRYVIHESLLTQTFSLNDR